MSAAEFVNRLWDLPTIQQRVVLLRMASVALERAPEEVDRILRKAEAQLALCFDNVPGIGKEQRDK